jgi:hypothetical protein
LPARKKNKAERETSLKHDPIAEYRNSVYRMRNPSETLLMFPGAGFKRALRNATADMPGATKAAIGRLTYVEEDQVPVYGTPELWSTDVRLQGMAKTPDIRTRAILPHWAAGPFTLTFQAPLLNETAVVKLLAAAGEIIGIGDDRPEKGYGSKGRFRLVDKKEFSEYVKKIGGVKEQEQALAKPDYYDPETEDLVEWFLGEAQKRNLKPRENGGDVVDAK